MSARKSGIVFTSGKFRARNLGNPVFAIDDAQHAPLVENGARVGDAETYEVADFER